MSALTSFASLFPTGAWAVLKTVVILILTFIIAAIVKLGVLNLLPRTRLMELLKKVGVQSGRLLFGIWGVVCCMNRALRTSASNSAPPIFNRIQQCGRHLTLAHQR